MKKMKKLFPILKSAPQDYEKWLEDLASQGWHLEKINFGGFLHHFVKGEPSHIRYCYDFQEKKNSEY